MSRNKDKTKPYHHKDLKSALIKAGMHIISEKGIDALSLRAVAREAGVSHSAPYAHFPNKTSLLLGIAEQGYRMLMETGQSIPIDPEKNFREYFKTFIKKYINFGLENRDYYLLMFGGFFSNTSMEILNERSQNPQWKETDVPNYVQETGITAFNYIINLVEIGQNQKAIKDGDSHILASHIWVSIHGLTISLIHNAVELPSQLSTKNSEPAELFVDYFYENLFKGIGQD